jgi:hypothetical protein
VAVPQFVMVLHHQALPKLGFSTLSVRVFALQEPQTDPKEKARGLYVRFVLASIMMPLGHRNVPRLIGLIRERQDRRVYFDKY